MWFKFVLLEPCLGRVGLSPLATFVALVLLSLSLDDWEFTFFFFSLLVAWDSHELRTFVCLLYITDLSRSRLESQRGPVRILLSLRLWRHLMDIGSIFGFNNWLSTSLYWCPFPLLQSLRLTICFSFYTVSKISKLTATGNLRSSIFLLERFRRARLISYITLSLVNFAFLQ